MRRLFQFKRPKGPGFGISAGFYLTVLSSKATLPPLLSVMAPNGENGAVEGFAIPLGASGEDKSILAEPIRRGGYALTSKDRKTIIRMMVLSKEEAGFDPEFFAASELASISDPELVNRVRGTWTILQLAFETHDPNVYPSVRLLLAASKRLAELTEGVVADSISRRYLLPKDVFHEPAADPKIDARDVVSVTTREQKFGTHFFTLGMSKFNLPEFELTGVEPHAEHLAPLFLLGLAQTSLLGDLPELGAKAGADAMPFELRQGGLDLDLWGDHDVIELLPPSDRTSSEALIAWASETAV